MPAEDAAKLNDRLLDAAQALFTEKGFNQTTMDEIARHAGSSTQTIYARFPNKTEMLEAVVRRVVETSFTGQLAETVTHPRDVAPRDFLIAMGRRVSAILSNDDGGLTRIGLSEAHRSREIQRLSMLGYVRGVSIIKSALEEWRAQSVLRPQGDLETTATICLTMMVDRARIRAALGLRMSPDEIEAHVTRAVDIFLKGCEAK